MTKIQSNTDKVVVIVGSTASGKTSLAIDVARQYNGEIISADSRQVYRGMDVGTGKDLAEYQQQEVVHHLIDIVNPQADFTVEQYQEKAYQAIEDILQRGKLPLLVGGTGLYVSAVVEGYQFPTETADKQQVRQRLDKKTLPQLLAVLKQVDPDSWHSIDQHNRRRVQRALEIYYTSGQPQSFQRHRQAPPYTFCKIGLRLPPLVLRQRIHDRLMHRLEHQDMVEEAQRLHQAGLSWKRMEEFGLEYRWLARYLKKELSYEDMVTHLEIDIRRFAKRQLTWFKRDRDIVWVEDFVAAQAVVKNFLQ